MTFDFRFWGRKRVRFIPAAELNECGISCLAAIAEFHEGEQDLSAIRRRAKPSGRGNTLADIRELAEIIGLSARGVRTNPAGLKQIKCPAILHWEMNHFVVLERADSAGVTIVDPAAGRMQVPWETVDSSYTGVALEIEPTERWIRAKRPQRQPTVLSLLAPMSQWRGDVIVIAVLTLMLECLVLILPTQIQVSVDNAINGPDLRFIWIIAAGFTIASLLQAVISTLRAWTTSVLSARVGYALKSHFVDKLHRKKIGFFLRHHTSDILSRSRSVDTIQALITSQLLQALLDMVVSVAIILLLFMQVPQLATVIIGFAALSALVTLALRKHAVDISRRSLRMAAMADLYLIENTRAARAIRLFGRESVRIAIWRNKFIDTVNLALSDSRVTMFSSQATHLCNSLGNVALIAIGSYMVIQNEMTVGTMLMFFMFRSFLVERLNNAVIQVLELRRVQANAERVADIISDRDEITDEYLPFERPRADRLTIEARDVWFRYGRDSPWLLKGASLTIKDGESIAITGSSGSGKSTLMNLLLGVLQPERGEIFYNGRDVRSISPSDLATLVGVVMQEDTLFQGTIAENISFYESPFDLDRVRSAADQANIAMEVESMPLGYYSVLAESGGDISGGQKQRLFIARALYHRPSLLFLDEATSHLDEASEAKVNSAIRALSITRVLVAHRRGTIATADRVIAIEPGGTLREVGIEA